MSEASAYCEDLVRRWDTDRHLATGFAPARLRADLFALYAFNFEVAKTAETVSQPVMGQIRLRWWRETVDGIYGGTVREQPVALALADAVRAHALPKTLFDELIDARELDIETAPFADLAAMEAYAVATSGNVMRLAARVLGAGDALDAAAREAGIAYALMGLLRTLPFAAARRHLVVPLDLLAAAGLDVEVSFNPSARERLAGVIAVVAKRAMDHLRDVPPVPRRLLPALLPAALVPLHARALARGSDVPHYRRHLAMTRAMLLGRL